MNNETTTAQGPPDAPAIAPGPRCAGCPTPWATTVGGCGRPSQGGGIAVVGEAPGTTELRRGEPFVGLSGALLTPLLDSFGLSRQDVWLTSAVMCAQPGDEVSKEAVAACRPRLLEELRGASKVLILGATALRAVFPKLGGISHNRGRRVWSEELGCWTVATWHPAYVLRFPEAYRDVYYDVEKFWQTPLDFQLPQPRVGVQLVDGPAQALVMRAALEPSLAAGKMLGLDTETTGLDPVRHQVYCIGISDTTDYTWVVTERAMQDRRVHAAVKRLLEDPRGRWVGHNAKFDANMLRGSYGIEWRYVADSMIMHYALDERKSGTDAGGLSGGHGLKGLSAMLFDAADYDAELKPYLRSAKAKKGEVFRHGENRIREADPAKVYQYLALDVHYTLRLEERLRPELREDGVEALHDDLLMSASRALSKVEFAGMALDVPYLEQLNEELAEKEERLKADLQRIAEEFGFRWRVRGVKVKKPRKSKKALAAAATTTVEEPPAPEPRPEDQQLGATLVTSRGERMSLDQALDQILAIEDGHVYTGVFNPASSHQVAKLLYEDIGLTPPPDYVHPRKKNRRVTDKPSPPSTDKAALTWLEHPVASKILELRLTQRLRGTYVRGMLNRVSMDSRIRGTFLIHGTSCVTGDTLILTGAGLQRADELCQQVEGWHEERIPLATREGSGYTSHTLVTRDRDVVNVRLGMGLVVRCTPEHPFYTQRGWVEARSLTTSDYCQVAFGRSYFPVTSPTSAQRAFLLGAYLSDGYVRWDEKNAHYTIRIANQDERVRQYIRESALQEWPTARVTYDETNGTMGIGGKEIVRAWKQVFPVNGAYNKHAPKEAYALTREGAINFLRGCSLDGHWGETDARAPRVVFTSCDEERARLIHYYLLNLGVRASLEYRAEKWRTPTVPRTGTVSTAGRWFVKCSGWQAIRYMEIIGPVSRRQEALRDTWESWNGRDWGAKGFRIDGNDLYAQVRGVTSAGSETVYDFTVPGDASFVANSCVVHNTGRLSSQNPNLQNIPSGEKGKVIKRAFVAPPGWVLVAADMSQLELRVVAALSNDENLIGVYLRDEDLHMAMACRMFGLPPEAITTEMRRAAKAVNFGVVYCIGPEGLAAQLNVSVEEARSYITSFFAANHGVRRFVEHNKALVHPPYQEVVTPFDRHRRFPFVPDNKRTVEEMHRQAVNFPVQSVASDITLLSLARLVDELDPREARVVSTVHDSIMLEVRADRVDRVCRFVKSVMEDPPVETRVPFKVDIEVGPNWAEVKKWQEAVAA